MSKHWLFDYIDFSGEPHGWASPDVDCDDSCDICNGALKEIEESLALDGFPPSRFGQPAGGYASRGFAEMTARGLAWCE